MPADNFFSRPRPCRVDTAPVALNIRIMLPTVSLETFKSLDISLCPFSFWCKATISSLDVRNNRLAFTMHFANREQGACKLVPWSGHEYYTIVQVAHKAFYSNVCALGI